MEVSLSYFIESGSFSVRVCSQPQRVATPNFSTDSKTGTLGLSNDISFISESNLVSFREGKIY